MKHLALVSLPVAVLLATSNISTLSQSLLRRDSSLSAAYGNLPLLFESNQGQAAPSIEFVAHGIGYTLVLGQTKATLALHSSRQLNAGPAKLSQVPANRSTSLSSSATVRIQLVGAKTSLRAIAENLQITRTNYFLGNNPANWRTNIPNYQKVRYHSVYDGIDLVYYGNQGQLEHDFVVSPGADPGSIKLSFKLENSSSSHLRLEPHTGDLLLNAGGSDLRLLKPVTYQQSNGQRALVPSRYKLLPGNQVAFVVGAYNHAQPLIIDPVLVYSTYLGGSGGGDSANGIAVDSNGNSYITGTTNSADFPITAGAFQKLNGSSLTSNGGTVFISKLNPLGTALIYSTYLGGSGGDFGYAIAVDSANNAYVTGATYSTDFPVTCAAAQITNNSTARNATNAFVVRLSAEGSRLTYSTYLGGKGNLDTNGFGDIAQSIAVSPSGHAYVAGYTASADFPVTDKAFQLHFKGSGSSVNAFVTELNPAGTAFVYSTYLGASGSGGAGDLANGIALDSAGNAYVAGSTTSSDFPVTRGVFQTTRNAPTTAFVTELNPDGTDLLYSTYLGGTSGESAQAIAVDSQGSAYVGGSTTSNDFPVTAGVVEGATFGANTTFLNGFVTKLAPDAATLAYSTHLEGHDTTVTAIAVDGAGAAYVAGFAAVPGAEAFGGFHATPGGLPTPKSPDNSAFLVKLDPAATVFNYATLIGGNLDDRAMAIALDSAGNAYIAGHSSSPDFPTSSSAFQKTNHAKSGSNAFVSKFTLASAKNQTAYIPVPSDLGTNIVVNSSAVYQNCGAPVPDFEIIVDLTVNTNQPGPPLNGGTVGLDGYPDFSAYAQVYGTWGSQSSGVIELYASGGEVTESFTAGFGGDPLYLGSTTSGNATFLGCGPDSISRTHRRAIAAPKKPSSPALLPAKFFPPPQPIQNEIYPSKGPTRLYSQSDSNCINTLPTLTVVLNSYSRLYGAANPTFNYTITGLLNGDTVTVVPATTATQTSPVGSYSITATISGTALTNYILSVQPGILSVGKAPLHIQAHTVNTIYGHTPPALTGYNLIGFLNGDTASVVSGAPVLTTTVTVKTPVGFYQIGVKTGTLTAANYYFVDADSGMGLVGVYKAPLTIQARDVRSTYGQAPPTPTAYNLVGFVNGDNAGVVSGIPLLSTTVTAATHPGSYPIHVQIGTLTAANYFFNTAASPQGVVEVAKAVLVIHAHTINTTYGQPPPPLTAYDLIGFVNGDTATVVSGAPLLTTTVTAATPVGFYQVGVHTGTLTAANYTFSTTSNGMGLVGVYKAPLKVKANNLSMAQGGSVPALTYAITGFVNGDTAATAVTGAPVLSTTATSSSRPGTYPITIARGTLTAQNYSFTTIAGTLTISP